MKKLPMKKEWKRIRAHFRRSVRSNSHFVVTLVDDEGYPRPMPIGSVALNREEPGGYFIEKFTSSFARFGEEGQQICVLAVNTNTWFWLRSLLKGQFYRPPAIRLYGRLGKLREGTAAEKERFQRLVRPARRTKGYKIMWKDMNRVRELTFERAEGANLGLMTDALWKNFVGSAVERVVH